MAATQGKDEQKPMLLVLTGPILNFLASRENRDGPEIQLKPQQFWPFAVAGVTLFGVGIWGGTAFMKGDVPSEGSAEPPPPPSGTTETGGRRRRAAAVAAEQHEAAAAAQPAAGGRRRTARMEGAAEGALPRKLTSEAEALAHRAAAVKAASASLALGTLLALTGAAVLVQTTRWYLQVDTAKEFADKMRSMLPERARGVSDSVRLTERKDGVAAWFQGSSIGVWIRNQEDKSRLAQRKKDAENLHKKGILTEEEMHIEVARVEEEERGRVGAVGA